MIRTTGLQWGVAGRPLTPPLDLHLAAGSLTAVVGANGCGKSSLLRVLAGLQKPLAGRVQLAASGLGAIGYLQQQTAIDRQFPVELAELVAAGLWRARLPRAARRARLDAVLAAWGLSELAGRPLIALSGGELQRGLLARLELTEAPLLLLDEPVAALDEAGQQLLWQRLADAQRRGCTQLVVCHDLAGAREHLPDCLVIHADGCRHGPSRALLTAPLAQVA
ncbi:ATP-binding cassette domain-containing protein [Pseudomonas sp. NW5]|uniref:metal ABC transporter ATP-binding protein n=1 Tax=Pseudomonas sp. NW5 TaxID=2934934 RepID=UPI0020209BD9|nr:ATP-binding cassette domain-containing protein [Pseudomonas sp. NW5]MCL7461376.1 ATP-binding cassette domain-containing protein [Pseudomonas sp. NW5]